MNFVFIFSKNTKYSFQGVTNTLGKGVNVMQLVSVMYLHTPQTGHGM